MFLLYFSRLAEYRLSPIIYFVAKVTVGYIFPAWCPYIDSIERHYLLSVVIYRLWLRMAVRKHYIIALL